MSRVFLLNCRGPTFNKRSPTFIKDKGVSNFRITAIMRPESECGSMKLLLKQVYGVHTSRVKCLEDEIEELKKKLHEAEANVESECKRCIELEDAFNGCKAALLEQSKMFENLGQKFLNCNPAENKTTSRDKTAECLQESSDCNVSNNITPVAAVKKVGLSSNTRIHFLKNLMSLNVDDNPESLDFSVPLQKNMNHEYSTLNPDSMVLVPNTLDFTCDFEEKKKVTNNKKEACKTIDNDVTKDCSGANVTENIDNKVRKKKRNSDESELNNVKLNKENETKLKKLKTSAEENFKIASKAKESTSPKYKNSKKEVDVSIINDKKKSNVLDIKIQKVEEDDFLVDSKKNIDKNSSKSGAPPKDESFMTIVSPSLLPLGEKTNTKAVHNPLIIPEEDIYDFEDLASVKKIPNEGGTWTTCDKRKLTKKVPNLRPIKSSSKFKMHLDSLPPNYKKPNYRQTKLSKSIFQPKSTVDVKQEEDSEVECIDDKEDSGKEFIKAVPATACSSKTVDFDATCIPENYEYEVVPSCSMTPTNANINPSEACAKDESDYSDCDDSSEIIVAPNPAKHDKAKESSSSKHMDPSQLGNSFDRLPKRSEPDYKYKEETVRKKSERKQLTAFDCKECEKYYSELGLSDEEKKQRMQKCSRHRSKFAPPPTPEHFWELEFPDTQECKARGYLNETQKVKLKTHRKRPL